MAPGNLGRARQIKEVHNLLVFCLASGPTPPQSHGTKFRTIKVPVPLVGTDSGVSANTGVW